MALTELTVSIGSYYYDSIQKEAKRQHKTEQQILEEVIKLYAREKKKEFLLSEYKKMANDKGYLEESRELAEWGMDYYLIDIDNAYK